MKVDKEKMKLVADLYEKGSYNGYVYEKRIQKAVEDFNSDNNDCPDFDDLRLWLSTHIKKDVKH